MKETPYTIYLSQEELNQFEDIKQYDYMNEESTPSVFKFALYPIFNYYKKRTPHIEIFTSPVTASKNSETLSITETDSFFRLVLQKLFPRQEVLLVNKREARLDVERTWNIISNSRELKEYKNINVSMHSWTKLVYAYRLNKVYGLSILDTTIY